MIIAFCLMLGCMCCQTAGFSSEDQPDGEITQKVRLYNNGLPADGCDYRIAVHVDTAWVEFAPDAESRTSIEKFATENLDFTQDYHGYKEVQVTGKLLKSEQTLHCGWGATRKLPGITISKIQK